MNKSFEQSRRDFLSKALQSGAFARLAGTSLLAPAVHAFGQVPKELPAGKSIYDIQGEVLVNKQKANKDTFISANALVETGSNSFIIFAVGKDAHILRENSQIQLSGKDDTFEDTLRLITGKLLSVFGERDAGEKHTLHTTTATIGIRGTGVYAESAPDHSYLCTCYGLVDIASNQDKTSMETIKSQHHDAPRYILADGHAGKLITPAPMKNHDDEELMLVEALVGRTPPFSSVMNYGGGRRGY